MPKFGKQLYIENKIENSKQNNLSVLRNKKKKKKENSKGKKDL